MGNLFLVVVKFCFLESNSKMLLKNRSGAPQGGLFHLPTIDVQGL